MKRFLVGLVFAIYARALVAGAEDDFVAMRQAFQTGDAVRVALYAQRLQGHVLEPYAAYYQLRPQLENAIASPDLVRKFLFQIGRAHV